MSPADQTCRGTPAALSCSDTTAVLWSSPFVRGGEFFSPNADRDSKTSPSLLPAFVCGAVTAGVGDRCTFPPARIQEQQPDLLLFPQPYCHLNPSDSILAVPRGQEHPAGALEALQSSKAEKNEDKIESWSCEREAEFAGAPASHKPGWDLQALGFQLVGKSWASL